MKAYLLIAVIMLQLVIINHLWDKESEINFNLARLSIDWGYLENYHPLLLNERTNTDSIFCSFADQIINQNISYSSDNLMRNLNSKTTIATSSDITYYKNLFDRYKKHSTTFQTSEIDSLLHNRITIFNESAHQQSYKQSLKYDQPYPTESMRIIGVSKIWNNYKFYYPYKQLLLHKRAYEKLLIKYIGLVRKCKNFNVYHLIIRELTSEYKDTHSQSTSFIINNHFGARTIPVKVRYMNNKLVVCGFYSEDIENKSNLQTGDFIIEVNNKRIDDLFTELKSFIASSNKSTLYRDLSHYALLTNRDSICLLIKRNHHYISTTILTSRLEELQDIEYSDKKNHSILKLNDTTLYINCKFVDTSELRNVLLEDRQYKWFIFDLRSSTQWIKPIVEDFFFQSKSIFAHYYLPLPSDPSHLSNLKPLTIGPSKPEYQLLDPHVFILVNENTQSQGEFQTMFLQAIPKSITIGSKTAGTDGNTLNFTIPGNISVRMTFVGLQYPDGKETQRNGVKIDYLQSPSLYDIKHKIDKELNFALQIIKGEVK